jgi:predicted nucleic acid-binding protein
MTDRLFFDTNVLVYLLDPGEAEKRRRATELLRLAIQRAACIVSPQTLNECYRVLTHKRRFVPEGTARAFIDELTPYCEAPLDVSTTRLAFAVEDMLGGSWWDCVMVASALQAGCRLFLTEDLQHGRSIEGMEIVNPFTSPLPAILQT